MTSSVVMRKWAVALSAIACLVSSQALGQTLVSKTTIVGNVVHYYWLLTTSSPAPFNQVGVHRVVEQNGNGPIRSTVPVFLAHGTLGTFNDDFMDGTSAPGSMPVFMAQQGIDVWGIDYAWSLVPESQTNFQFMKDWGMQRDINDLEQAIGFARGVRAQTGSDGRRVALLGFSYSGSAGYALLNEETKLPCSQRQVNGYIPVDVIFTTNDAKARTGACQTVTNLEKTYIDNGIFENSAGVIAANAGALAMTQPNATSPYLSQYTNLQFVLVEFAATWLIAGVFPPFGHYVAGTFGPGGINTTPTGFHYTAVSRVENVLVSEAPFQPFETEIDLNAIPCGKAPAQYSDNLSAIRVPVLYLGAAGGEGALGLYTLSQLGSADIQSDIVSFYPPSQYALDYGHYDLFDADNAATVVWPEVATWLLGHAQDVCY